MFRSLKHARTTKPQARTEGLSITVSGDETLVYDREQFVIHRLSAEAAAIWRLADGTRDLATIAAESGVRNVDEMIGQLTSMGLMQGEPMRTSLFTRRRVLAGAGGAVAAGTFIAPVAASPVLGQRCNVNGPGNWYPGPCAEGRPNSSWSCSYAGQDQNGNYYTWQCFGD